MRIPQLIGLGLFALATAVGANGVDVNSPTGTHGLIMIDKLGALVRFFDPSTLQEISTLKIEGTPHELAISPDHKTAYVPDYGNGVYGRNPNPGHTIAVIDLESRRVRGTIDLSPHVAPHGLQVDANGTLYASCDISRKFLVIDPKTFKVMAAIDTEGTGHWAAVLNDGSKAYVANKNDRRFVSVIDLKQRAMIAKIPMPNGTQGISVASDGKHVLAVDLVEPTIAVIDTRNDTIVGHINVDGATKGLWRARYSPDDAHLLVLNSSDSSVSVLDAQRTQQQRVIKTGKTPFGLAFASDSKTALIGNHGDGTVDVIDLSTLQIIKSFKAGTGIETLSYY